jgi:uncharacterized lipoprotein YddW (UPF0748 family)
MSFKQILPLLLILLSAFGCKRSQTSDLLEVSEGLPTGEVRAIWLTHHDFLGKSDSDLSKLVQNLKEANINTVFLSVYSKGYTFWPSPTMKAAGGDTTHLPWAQKMLKLLRDQKFWVGAWFEYGLAGGRPSNKIVKAHSEWFQRSIAGKAESPENRGFYFFSPSHPEVQKFITSLLTEVAKMGFDEIQLDRFRWTASSTKVATDFGYEDSTRLAFNKKYGHPSNFKPKLDDPAWKAWRKSAVNQIVKQASQAIRKVNPKIVISASPVGYYGVHHFLQDWTIWLKESYLDAVYPQMYAHNIQDFKIHLIKIQTLMKKAGISNRSKLRKVGAGILVNGSTSQTVENSFIDLARRAGFHDFSLWVYNLNHKKSAINAPLARFATQYRLWKGPGVNPWNRNLQFSEPQKQSSPAASSEGGGSEKEEPSIPEEVPTESAGAGEAVSEEAIPEQAVTPEEGESEQVIDPSL